MDIDLELLKVLTVLLPGFVTTGIIHSLCVEEVKTDLDKIVRALVYSFLTYCFLTITRSVISLFHHKQLPSLDVALTIPKNACDVVMLLSIAVILGLVVSLYREHDGHRWLRKLKITSRSTRFKIWHDVFIDKRNCDVALVLKDGRQLFGWPEYYSDDSEDGSIFLTQARWYYYNENNELIDESVPDPGILIRCADNIDFIQFQFRNVSIR